MIDKEKKQKLDDLYLKYIYNDGPKSTYIIGLAKKVSDFMVLLNYGYEEVYDLIAIEFYKNMIKKAEKESIEDLNEEYMRTIYKYTEKSMRGPLYPRSRICYIGEGKSIYDSSVDRSIYEIIIESEKRNVYLYDCIPDQPMPETTETFLTHYFNDNYKEIFKRSPKTLDYIEHPYPRRTSDFLLRTKEKTIEAINKDFGTHIERTRRKKYSPEKNQEIIKKNNYYYKIAEKKAVITIIDQTITAEHIGQEFNKHKDNRYLFDMFYDNMTAASRRSINKEEYSNESITELLTELNKLRNKLVKETESSDNR